MGTTTSLIDAINAKCIDDGDLQLSTGTTFSSNSLWIIDANYNTVADAINNIWIAVCDMFTYLTNLDIKTTVVAAGNNISVSSLIVGDTTTYTVNSIGLDYFYAQVTIGGPNSCNTASATIPNVVNAPGKVVAYGGILPGTGYPVGPVQDLLQYNYMDSNGAVVSVTGSPYTATAFIGSSVPVSTAPSSTFLTVNNFTGVFTITKKGEYLITMSCFLKAADGNDEYWKTSGDDGRFDIGICSGGTNSRDIFTGASKSIVANMDSNIILTAQCVVTLNVTSQVIFRMLNLTGSGYAGGSYGGSDSIRIGFVKLRDL
jgi:hypothetical protein